MTCILPTANPSDNKEILKEAKVFRRLLFEKDNLVPFAPEDVTAGMENEFQVAVQGEREHVDLAVSLAESTYYRNIMLRADRGDLPRQSAGELKDFIEAEQVAVWENSWIRFPRHYLSPYADSVLQHDFLKDKKDPKQGERTDLNSFLFTRNNTVWLRLPISYFLKLSLAEAVSGQPEYDYPNLRKTGTRLMRHLISDNISPEITSFNLSSGAEGKYPGTDLACEASRRFFFIQLLARYGEQKFRLGQFGQKVHIYSAPTPPIRQKRLNNLISDTLYCHLFLNPCLSGWPRGEEKKEYMELCHRTMCRSQLNTISSLKEAGLLNNNLIVLPNISSTSLANNGTHITLGSKSLSRYFNTTGHRHGRQLEKYYGDLVIKIVEHFLPLFVTTYTAAPHRLSFSDFHPERVLGFLPHQLDPTHLRMIWRRWKKKAQLRFCGHNLTPIGPKWLDTLLAGSLNLKGDYIPDFRLINYLIALQSLESLPALNGMLHNQDILKKNLFEMGIFDTRMSMYLPYRMRDLAAYGFSGFEGRHYSLFPTFHQSLAGAANLQAMITALAYKWVATGMVTHRNIPDSPFVESERRQIFFNAAIGLPTFYVRRDTGNAFLRRILTLVGRQRSSRRYRGYIRIELKAYMKAALTFLKNEAGCTSTIPGLNEELSSLEAILDGTADGAADNLTRAIMNSRGRETDPLRIDATEFNTAAETYYRTDLCTLHMGEGLRTLIEDGKNFEKWADSGAGKLKNMITGPLRADRYIDEVGRKVIMNKANLPEIHKLLLLTLLIIEQEAGRSTSMETN